jgi:hypothetical protein
MQAQCSDVLIHIDEMLSDKAIHDLEADLSQIDGVYSACVNERARHLVLIDYDPGDIAAGYLLQEVQSRGIHAELIGL